MNKELTPLEALNTIVIHFILSGLKDEYKNDLDIIKTALKRLEELEKAFDTLSKNNEKVMKELSKEIEKNRALEIIKNKVNLTEANNSNETKQKCLVMVVLDSDKNFDLLREVLL